MKGWCLCPQVDIRAGGQLAIDVVAASIAKEASEAARLTASFPAWASVAASEAYHMHWASEPSEP